MLYRIDKHRNKRNIVTRIDSKYYIELKNKQKNSNRL